MVMNAHMPHIAKGLQNQPYTLYHDAMMQISGKFSPCFLPVEELYACSRKFRATLTSCRWAVLVYLPWGDFQVLHVTSVSRTF